MGKSKRYLAAAWGSPGLTSHIVEKILWREICLKETAGEIYHILYEAQKLPEDDRKDHYNRAFYTDPDLIIQLYDKYYNTDKEDLIKITMNLPAMLERKHAKYAYIKLQSQYGYMMIDTWPELRIWLSDHINENLLIQADDSVKESLKEVWKKLFAIYFTVELDSIRLWIWPAENTYDTSPCIEYHTYTMHLTALDNESQAWFIRQLCGPIWDLEDNIIYA